MYPYMSKQMYIIKSKIYSISKITSQTKIWDNELFKIFYYFSNNLKKISNFFLIEITIILKYCLIWINSLE